ncbi:hypothetical protein SESBI_05435 [Sesbania bispinosa]|nr:hypothetical protein SESBI_05435 [Sesbania bispinosa]
MTGYLLSQKSLFYFNHAFFLCIVPFLSKSHPKLEPSHQQFPLTLLFLQVGHCHPLLLRLDSAFLCGACEQAPPHVTCNANVASLCLASRHECLSVTLFFESVHSVKSSSSSSFLDNHRFFSDDADAEELTLLRSCSLAPNP